MSVATTAFLYLAIAATSGSLAFLAGQRSSGRTSPEVESSYEKALLLDSAARDLAALCEDAAKAEPEQGRRELETAHEELEEAIIGLRRGADLVV